jgi:hypothetical protein
MQYEFNYWYEAWEKDWQESFAFVLGCWNDDIDPGGAWSEQEHISDWF